MTEQQTAPAPIDFWDRGHGMVDPSAPGSKREELGVLLALPRAAIDGQLQRVEDGAMQEIATLRVALAVWARAADDDDLTTAQKMVPALTESSERLLNELRAMQHTVRDWLGMD